MFVKDIKYPMKKRDRLVITKTPEDSFQIDTDDTVLLETPKPFKRKLKRTNTVPVDLKLTIAFIKSYYVHFLLVSLVVLNVLFNRKPASNELKELRNAVYFLKRENLDCKDKLSFINAGPSNIASVEQGCTISYEKSSIPYKYGFLRRSYTDPHAVLAGDSECYSFEGSKGKIVLKFQEKKKMVGVGIFHRKTDDMASSPREIAVYIDDKKTAKLVFNPADIFQKVTFEKRIGSTVRFEVQSNHGKKDFTCIYRVFVYGW